MVMILAATDHVLFGWLEMVPAGLYWSIPEIIQLYNAHIHNWNVNLDKSVNRYVYKTCKVLRTDILVFGYNQNFFFSIRLLHGLSI